MRTPATVCLLVLVGGTGGCGRAPAFHLATAPTTPPAASVPSAEWVSERWNLTTTYLGATGLEACPSVGSPRVGAVGLWSLTTQWSGETLYLTVINLGNVSERSSYSGTTDGHAFTARTSSASGVMTCGDTRVVFSDEQSVTGRFSNDGRSLVGEEVYSMRLASGATLTWHSEWRATRQ